MTDSDPFPPLPDTTADWEVANTDAPPRRTYVEVTAAAIPLPEPPPQLPESPVNQILHARLDRGLPTINPHPKDETWEIVHVSTAGPSFDPSIDNPISNTSVDSNATEEDADCDQA